jgi:hypothetical protein
MVAYGAYKVSKKDANRIKDHTGRAPDQLSEAEMEQAMYELGIEKQYVDEDDQAYVQQHQDGGEAGPVASDAPAGEPDYLNELERLGHLRDEGYLTEEEFEMKRKQLLGL